MIDRHIVVLSGISPRVVEKMAATLRSVGIEPVTVKPDNSMADYFERLVKQTLFVALRVAAKGSVRLSMVMVSALEGPNLLAETKAFFPAVRRIGIRPEWGNNPSSAKQIVDLVRQHFQSISVKTFIQKMAAHKEPILLLPPKNTPSKALQARFDEIYACTEDEPGNKVTKQVVIQRHGRGLRAGNLQFVPVVNGEQHPVRRCTDTSACDLQAAFRFGAPVASRFEFDVTADNGLKAKTFYLCDNSAQRISSQPTHLNMRINDDFRGA